MGFGFRKRKRTQKALQLIHRGHYLRMKYRLHNDVVKIMGIKDNTRYDEQLCRQSSAGHIQCRSFTLFILPTIPFVDDSRGMPVSPSRTFLRVHLAVYQATRRWRGG